MRPLFDSSAWAKPATVVVGTPGEGSDLASVRLVGVGSGSHCGGSHDMRGRCFSLFLLGRRGLMQPLRWEARRVRAIL